MMYSLPISMREQDPAVHRARAWVMNTPFGAAGTGSVTFRSEEGMGRPIPRTSRRASLCLVVALVAVFGVIFVGFTLFLWWIAL